jgi:hypothetical protein
MVLKVDDRVTHPLCPEWGPGRVLLVEGHKVHVYFRDAREVEPGGAIKLLNLQHVTLAPYEGAPDPWLDGLPSLVRNGRVHPLPRARLTFVQAVEMFQAMYPGGFADADYVRDERDYKWKAHLALEKLGLRAGDRPAAGGAEFVDALLQSLKPLNLLALQERLAFKDGLRASPAAAEAYRDAVAAVCSAPTPDRALFETLRSAVSSLPAEPGAKNAGTWPVLT